MSVMLLIWSLIAEEGLPLSSSQHGKLVSSLIFLIKMPINQSVFHALNRF